MRLKELIYYAVSEIDGEAIALGTHYNHVCLFINAPPELAPSLIIYKVERVLFSRAEKGVFLVEN